MRVIEAIEVQPHDWGRGLVKAGERLRITNVEGKQVGDFVAFNANDPSEHQDCLYSQLKPMRWRLSVPDLIVSNVNRPMWRIVHDDHGDHYSGGGMCSREIREAHGLSSKKGCRETLTDALSDAGFAAPSLHQASCFNLFMHVDYGSKGDLIFDRSTARPGDVLELEAQMDVFWAVSVCIWPGISDDDFGSLKFERLASSSV